MIPDARLDELAAMEQAATAGEWRIDATLALGAYGVWRYDDATDKMDFICSVIDYAKDQSFKAVAVRNHNAAFITAARNEFAAMVEQCKEANRDRQDALRYRWLRLNGLQHINFKYLTPDTCDVGLDHAIDAALKVTS